MNTLMREGSGRLFPTLMETLAYFHSQGYGFDGLTSHEIAITPDSVPVILSQRLRLIDAQRSGSHMQVSDFLQGLHLLTPGKIRGVFEKSKGWMNILKMDYEGALMAVFHTARYKLEEPLSETNLSKLCRMHLQDFQDQTYICKSNIK